MGMQTQNLADSVRLTFGQERPPVNPFHIAREEGIILKPGICPGYDGRLEYIPNRARWILFYATGDESDPRTRFTIAHELGHYYIEEHANIIRAGQPHASHIDELGQRQRREEEANEFASDLLMPESLFGRAITDVAFDVLDRLCGMFGTSRASTARKMVQLTNHALSIVFIRDSVVQYAQHSAAMRVQGLVGIRKGDSIPNKSQTYLYMTTGKRDKAKAEIWASEWYGREKNRAGDRKIWEEVNGLGQYGYLTLLVYEP